MHTTIRSPDAARSYEAAVKLFDNIKPVRGWNADTRPLAKRTDYTKRVVLNDGGTYNFIYHKTGLVRWRSPSNVLAERHDSPSSRIFLNSFLPHGVVAISDRGQTVFRVGGQDFVAKQVMSFSKFNDTWTLDNPEAAERYYLFEIIDHKKARAMQHLAQDFYNWCRIAKGVKPKNRRPDTAPPARFFHWAGILLEGDHRFPEVYSRIGVSPWLLPMLNVVSKNVRKVRAPEGVIPVETLYSKLDYSGLIDESLVLP